MHGAGAVEDLGRSAPDHDQAGSATGLAELLDVIHEHLRLIHLGAVLLDVRPINVPDVFMIEDRLHRPDGGERFLELIEQRAVEDAGVRGRLISRVLVNVPAREDQVVQSSQRNKILDQRAAVIGSFASSRTVENCVSEPTGAPIPRF